MEAGNFFVLGFEGTAVTPRLRRLMCRRRPAGVVLFARNVESPEQVQALCTELQALADGPPLILAVDQEGGPVARLRRPFTELPAMGELSRSGSMEMAHRTGTLLGRELAAVGLNVDFAPVLDVNSNPANPVIGVRSLGVEPEAAARLGAALARGLAQEGVAACGKHFPGHGDTAVDSHRALPRVEASLDTLRARELVPFAAAMGEGLPMMMTAHVVYPALDARRPATFSPAAVDVLLRREMGFTGVVVTDDLCMGAATEEYGPEDMAAAFAETDLDLMLHCYDNESQEALLEAFARAMERGGLSTDRLARSAARIQALRAGLLPGPKVARGELSRVVGCAEHLAVAEEMRAAAVG